MRRTFLYRFLLREPYRHALWRGQEAALVRKEVFAHPMLDLGCGTGTFSSLLFRNIDVGLDISDDMLRKAKSATCYENLILADATKLPFRDSSFNSILSNCVLEHIPNLTAVLKEIRRVLNEKGRLVFTVPSELFNEFLVTSKIFKFANTLKKRHILKVKAEFKHYHYLSPPIWRDKLWKVGLRVREATYYVPPQVVMLWDLLGIILDLGVRKHERKYEIRSAAEKLPPELFATIFYFIFKPYVAMKGKRGGGLFIIAER